MAVKNEKQADLISNPSAKLGLNQIYSSGYNIHR